MSNLYGRLKYMLYRISSYENSFLTFFTTFSTNKNKLKFENEIFKNAHNSLKKINKTMRVVYFKNFTPFFYQFSRVLMLK